MYYSDETYRHRLRRYSLPDLESALRNLDKGLYPQRHFWIEAEIRKRKQGTPALAEGPGDGPSGSTELDYLRNPLNVFRGWVFFLASCLVIHFGFDMRSRYDLSRTDCTRVSGTLDHARLDSTAYQRRRSFRTHYHYFKIYGLAETDGAFKYGRDDFNAGRVWDGLRIGDPVEILYRPPENGYYRDPLEIIAAGDTLISFEARVRHGRSEGFGLIALGGFFALVSLGFLLFESENFMTWLRGKKAPPGAGG